MTNEKDLTAEECAALLSNHAGFNPTEVLRQLLVTMNREKKLREQIVVFMEEANQYRINTSALLRDVSGYIETLEGNSQRFKEEIKDMEEVYYV